MDEFENYAIEGIYISRIIASWRNVGGKISSRRGGGSFKDWLKSLVLNGRHLTEEEISDVVHLATNGKLELEMSARSYLKVFPDD